MYWLVVALLFVVLPRGRWFHRVWAALHGLSALHHAWHAEIEPRLQPPAIMTCPDCRADHTAPAGWIHDENGGY